MMEEGVDVGSFYVCVKFTFIFLRVPVNRAEGSTKLT